MFASLRALLTPWLWCVACLWTACETGAPSGPIEAGPAPLLVGPSPLRRLSNSEYLNALSDLFPEQSHSLPDLPSDGAVSGFDNAVEAQKPSDLRVARFETIANLYAQGATKDAQAVSTLVGCDIQGDYAADACATQFINSVGQRIFRRPLADDERERFAARFARFRTALDFEAAVRLSLSAMLQAPQFLYRPEPYLAHTDIKGAVPVEAYAMASRLSFSLWQSIPDEILLAAAAHDALHTGEQIRAQAERMLKDPRARRTYWNFHRQWLGLDRILDEEHQIRTSDVDPAWSLERQASASMESRLFVEHVVSDEGTLRDLLLSRRAWVDTQMAELYGLPALEEDAWTEVSLPESQRAGLLTRASFLAGHSHRGATSPPIRGNALQLRMLCKLPVSPPADADLTPPANTTEGPQTNRMLYEARTRPQACRGCHVGLNGFGFGFEHYSAAGGYVDLDHGLPIDARGAIVGTDVDGAYDGAIALSEALSHSAQVHQCASQQWVRYALGRAASGEEQAWVDALSKQFLASEGDIQGLLLEIVTAPAFRMRRGDGT